MAIAIGNKTASNQNPGGNSQTLTHNMSTGADGTLLVAITMSSQNSRNFTGCKYGGVSMTLVRNNYMGLTQRHAIYILQSPPTGNNNIVVTFNGNQWSSTSIFAVSFTGAGGVDSHGVNGASNTPNARSLTIASNSIIYASGISDNSMSPYGIAGSNRSLEFQHNTNKQVAGALSSAGLSAGVISVSTKAVWGTLTNSRIAIQEATSTPAPTGNSGNFLMMFN